MLHRNLSTLRRLRRCYPCPQAHNQATANRRKLWTTSLQPAINGFLDLALAIPYPLSFPPYTSTIILATIISRTLLTLPLSIWAKKRQWRLEEEALPRLKEFRNVAAKQIAQAMQKERFKGSIDDFRREHTGRLRVALRTRRKELFREHRCAPLATMLVPALTQLPVFVVSTIFAGQLAQRPTPLEDEAFLTLTSLARPDPTTSLPIALGVVTLANVETANWFVSEAKLARETHAQELLEKRREQGLPAPPSFKGIVQGSLRVFSILRIIIATMVDGSVLLYWLTSATYGLVQSWCFNWWDARKSIQSLSAAERRGPQ